MNQLDPPAAEPASQLSPDEGFERLHPNARWGFWLSSMLGFLVPYVPMATALLVAWDSGGLSSLAKAGLFVSGAILLLLLGWRFGSVRHARTRFRFDADALRIRRGVIWQSETLVPRSRVQHTDVNRGPLDRRLGLATLKVYTAGTKLASVSLVGLPDARAIELRDALIDSGGGSNDDTD